MRTPTVAVPVRRSAVALRTALPSPRANAPPLESTETSAVSEDVQPTERPASGRPIESIRATAKGARTPRPKTSDEGVRMTNATRVMTRNARAPVTPCDSASICVSPGAIPRTNPDWDTTATEGSSVIQPTESSDTGWPSLSSGVAVIRRVSPGNSESSGAMTRTLATDGGPAGDSAHDMAKRASTTTVIPRRSLLMEPLTPGSVRPAQTHPTTAEAVPNGRRLFEEDVFDAVVAAPRRHRAVQRIRGQFIGRVHVVGDARRIRARERP